MHAQPKPNVPRKANVRSVKVNSPWQVNTRHARKKVFTPLLSIAALKVKVKGLRRGGVVVSSPSPSSDGWRRSARPPRGPGPGGCAAAASWCGCTGWATAAAPTSSSPTISPRPPSATPAGPSPPRPPPPSRATVGACHHARLLLAAAAASLLTLTAIPYGMKLAGGMRMPSWFDIHDAPITSVSQNRPVASLLPCAASSLLLPYVCVRA